MTKTTALALDPEARPGVDRIREFLNPRSVAIVGASNSSMWSHFTLANLTDGGFEGEIWLVNRKGEPVHGRPTFATIRDLPGIPDLAILLTNSASTAGLLAECREVGIRNAVILAGGFSEAGSEGVALQRRIVEDARAADQLILGPNNLGFINTAAKTAAFSHMTQMPLVPGTVGVASQSGALSIYLTPYMAGRGVGTSVTVTVGNEAMLSAVDIMDFLVSDPGTKVIAAYLEQIARPEQFIAVAERARAAGKPVVVFKAGKAEAAARVAAAHTGSLVGDDRVTDAVMRQLGVIRVDSIEQLVSTAGLLAEYGALPGPRVGFVTGSGAMCSVIAERAEGLGIELPSPAASTAAGLHADGMPEEAAVNNPLDLTGITANNPTILAQANTRFADDDNFDVVVITGSLAQNEAAEQMAQASLPSTLASISGTSKPMIPMNFLATEINAYARDFAQRTGYPHVADSLDRGIPAIAHSIWWGRRMRELAESEDHTSAPVPLSVPVEASRWTEVEVGAFLRDNGVPVVPTVLAPDAEAAVEAAVAIGYPVVLKVASTDIPHKSDVGGVRLNLGSAEEVRQAYQRIHDAVAGAAPTARISGIAVAPMRSGGIELLVGVVRDPDWGPMLAVGIGGVFVELLHDSALRRLPVDHAEITRMLESLQGAKLLKGFRGGAAADMNALVQAIHAIGEVALRLGDRINALEINPLVVDGNRVEALDVLIDWNEG